MKRIVSFIFLCSILFLVGCSKKTTSLNDDDLETIKLNKIQEAIYMVNYPAKQGQIITGDLSLPTKYNEVTIRWETLNFPDIISPTGKVSRPDTCWIESRDQQGIERYPQINNDWPVVLKATFEYEGLTDTHKLLVVVKPREGFTCDKYLG